MSRAAVLERLCSAGAKTDCGALRSLGVVATRMEYGSRAWAHAGILYRYRRCLQFFELRNHQKLRDEPIKDEASRPVVVWIEPSLSRERALLIGGKCQLIAKCHQMTKVPYGFRFNESIFNKDGSLQLGSGELGLTCATIVAAIFASERIPLLDPSKWGPPDEADKQSRRVVLEDIRTRDREHAAALEDEMDAPRIRPEEVVAAAAIHPAIGTFDTLVDGAAVVTERLGL